MVATGTLTSYAAVLATALTLGACSGGDPGPTQDGRAPTTVHTSSSRPTTTTSSSGSTSAAPTTTEDPVLASIPKDARAETMDGAAAFARFYFDQLSRSFERGDPALLDGLFLQGCSICSDLYQSAAELKAKGRRHVGKTLEVTLSSVTVFDEKNRQVLVNVKQNAVPVEDSSGKRIETTKAGKGSFVAVLRFDKHWQIREIGRPV